MATYLKDWDGNDTMFLAPTTISQADTNFLHNRIGGDLKWFLGAVILCDLDCVDWSSIWDSVSRMRFPDREDEELDKRVEYEMDELSSEMPQDEID